MTLLSCNDTLQQLLPMCGRLWAVARQRFPFLPNIAPLARLAINIKTSVLYAHPKPTFYLYYMYIFVSKHGPRHEHC